MTDEAGDQDTFGAEFPDPMDKIEIGVTGKDVWLDVTDDIAVGTEVAITASGVVTEVGDKQTADGQVHFAKVKLSEISPDFDITVPIMHDDDAKED